MKTKNRFIELSHDLPAKPNYNNLINKWDGREENLPALFGLFREKQLPSTVQIIGYARSHLEDEEFKQRISEHFKGGDEKTKTEFLKLVSYISGPYDTDEGYKKLESRCQEYEKANKDKNDSYTPERLFYLALPPSVFTTVCEKVKKNVYPPEESKGKLRIIIEKPFGVI
ncbi:Glucose-6-phosphate dehydrogenase, NAD binding domain family protein [Candida albicans]|uniref:glucose-6-phosphate dehydrogenase (NADP(+)) n=1 Tax=Candida albicans TaxID=5476 RepID=A0A8H6F0M8_CANAX|nr:Glucose-6-phosphate dehydrogenase, NAD binding domain family protein [Candida albicans]